MVRIFKHIASLLATLATIAAVVSSCSANFEPEMNAPNIDESDGFSITFGVLNPDSATILTDSGTTLTIKEYGSSIGGHEGLYEHQGRIAFNYTITDIYPETDGYYIRLNRIYPLVVKDIILTPAAATPFRLPAEPLMSSGPKDEPIEPELILRHPAMPSQAGMSGGYININVCYRSDISPEEHTPDVELYFDGDASTSDTLCFQLIYDAEEAWGSVNQYQWFSFRIVDEILPATTEANLYVFYWSWWLNERDPSAGTDVYVSILHPDIYSGGRVTTMGH